MKLDSPFWGIFWKHIVQNRGRSLPTETLLKKSLFHQGYGGGNFNKEYEPQENVKYAASILNAMLNFDEVNTTPQSIPGGLLHPIPRFGFGRPLVRK
jgi:hypothetical protein